MLCGLSGGLTDITVGSNRDVFHNTCIAGDSRHLLKCDQKSHTSRMMTCEDTHQQRETGRAGASVVTGHLPRTLRRGTNVTERISSMWPRHLKFPDKWIPLNLCIIRMPLPFPEVAGIKSQRSLQVTGVQRSAAEADGAAHHSGQSQDRQQDGPPMRLHRIHTNIAWMLLWMWSLRS